MESKTFIVLAGCFWGTEMLLKDHPGVTATKTVYSGGESSYAPTYYTLDNTNHSEAVEISCNQDVDLKDLLRVIIEKSKDDPSPMKKPRYHRGLICETKEIRDTIARYLGELGGYPSFNIRYPIGQVFVAEDYHQGYYERVLA